MTLTTINLAALGDTINLGTEVTGTLPTGNGGTGSTATTFVNAATNVTGTLATTNGGTGATSFTPGKLLQVQNFTTTTSITTTSTSFAATILTDQITPSATSSEILIFINGGRSSYQTGQSEGVQSLYVSVGGGGYSEVVSMMESHVNGGTNGYGKPATAFNYLHSPNTTSTLDYKVYIKTNTNGYVINSSNARICMSLMEIAA